MQNHPKDDRTVSFLKRVEGFRRTAISPNVFYSATLSRSAPFLDHRTLNGAINSVQLYVEILLYVETLVLRNIFPAGHSRKATVQKAGKPFLKVYISLHSGNQREECISFTAWHKKGTTSRRCVPGSDTSCSLKQRLREIVRQCNCGSNTHLAHARPADLRS